MYFSELEVEKMQRIFMRLDTTTIESLQYYTEDNKYRTGCTIVILNKSKKPICIFQNFKPLSPYRMKLLMRISEQIPYKIHITQPQDDIMTIGWKIEK